MSVSTATDTAIDVQASSAANPKPQDADHPTNEQHNNKNTPEQENETNEDNQEEEEEEEPRSLTQYVKSRFLPRRKSRVPKFFRRQIFFFRFSTPPNFAPRLRAF